GAGIHALDLLEGDAEFILICPGGDLGVRAGVHVRIHSHCDWRDPLEPSGHALDAVQLRFAFNVERINAAAQREFNFRFGLADSGESASPRRSARCDHAAQFALADDVEAATEVGECAQDSEV